MIQTNSYMFSAKNTDVPPPAMGLHTDKPIVNLKYSECT